MADYDSDSSGAEDIETGVTLGYATKDATGDDFSQLGGRPVSNFGFCYTFLPKDG
jgi:pre-rRNA-processing protein TSR4